MYISTINKFYLHGSSRETLGLVRKNIFLALIMLIISDDVLIFGSGSKGSIFFALKIAVYCGIITWFFLKRLFYGLPRSIYFLVLCFVLSIVLTQLINSDFIGGYGYQIIVFVVALQISIECNAKLLLFYFQKIIIILSALSVLIFFAYELNSNIFDFSPTISSEGGVTFKNLIISNIYTDRAVNRNPGIFREPGVFSIYITLSLMLGLYFFKNISKFKLLILLTALITTYSTSGYLVSFFLLVGCLNYKSIIVAPTRIVSIVIGVTAIFFVFTIPEVGQVITLKFQSNSDTYDSTISRLASFFVPFSISMLNPLNGVGLTDFEALFPIYSFKIFGIALSSGGHSSNTFMPLIGTYGWVFGISILFLLFKFAKFISSNKFEIAIVFGSLLLLYSAQDMRYSIVFWVILLIGLKLRVRYK